MGNLTTKPPAKIQIAHTFKVADINIYTLLPETLKHLKSCNIEYEDTTEGMEEHLIDVEDLQEHLQENYNFLSPETRDELEQINALLEKKYISYLRLISE